MTLASPSLLTTRRLALVTILVAVAAVLLGPAAPADAQLYDNFNAPKIDPNKWAGDQFQPAGLGGLRMIRRIEFAGDDGHLLLSHRVVGTTATSLGQQVSSNELLFLQNPTAITAVKFDLMVTDVNVVGCGASPSIGRAEFASFLFNDGSSTGPGDQTGNIFAMVGLIRRSDSADPPGTLRAIGFLFRCGDGTIGCPNGTLVGSVIDLGPVRTGELITLWLNWDRTNKKVDFQKNAEPVQSIRYALDDSRPAINAFRALRIRGQGANCTSGPRPFADMTATFDNVLINSAAVMTPPNNPPVATPQTVTTRQEVPKAITLSGTDVETPTEFLTYRVTTGPRNGALNTTTGRNITYTPAPGFIGTDSFQFTVTDRGAPDNCGLPGPLCAPPLTSPPATVTIIVSRGPTASATSVPFVTIPPPFGPPQFLGDIVITESAAGDLPATGRIVLSLPPSGFAFAAESIPSVSTMVGGGLELVLTGPDAPRVEFGLRFSFAIARSSSSGPASILISRMLVVVPFEVPAGPVLTDVGGTNPGLLSRPVQNATAVRSSTTPALTDVSPASAGQGATQTVVITGVNFLAGATPSFGAGITVNRVVVNSSTRITVDPSVASSAAVGTRDVTVINPGGQSATLPGIFRVRGSPTVTGVQGTGQLFRNVASQRVTILGTNFLPPTTSPPDLRVAFSGEGITVAQVGFTDSTTIIAQVDVARDAPLGSRTVTVTNPDGGSATSAGGVVNVADPPPDAPVGLGAPGSSSSSSNPPPVPTIGSITPNPAVLPATVTISGTAFSSPATVSFAAVGGTRVSVSVPSGSVTSSTISNVPVPSQAVDGPVTVTANTVVSGNSVNFSISNPRLSTVIPASGSQGTTSLPLALTGTKFASGATVAFAPATGITITGPVVFTDSNHLQVPVALAADAPLGSVAVTVTNPAGAGASTLPAAFQINPPVLAEFQFTINGVDPSVSYLPTVDNVSVTLDSTGKCTAKSITPHAVTLNAHFTSSAGATLPANATATFTLTPSQFPGFPTSMWPVAGTATNEDCEPGPQPLKDFSFSATDNSVQQITVNAVGNDFTTQLFSWDWGGSVQVTVAGTATLSGQPLQVTSNVTLPTDTDQDGLPDIYEIANGLDPRNRDQDGNGVPDGLDRFARDGVTNFAKYRGVYFQGPTAGATGAMTGLTRLGPNVRHLFVRGRGFGNDPAVQAVSGTCGMNVDPLTGAVGNPVPDSTLTPNNPCPIFEVGSAFAAIGVEVDDVTASFSANGATVFPRQSLMTPTSAILDMATIVYDATNCFGGEICDHSSKFGVRQWSFPTLGFSGFGSTSAYGASASVFKKAVEAYFRDKPYHHYTDDPTRLVLAPDGTPMLAPITRVGDNSSKGADNGLIDGNEATINGHLAGDAYFPGSFAEQLSAMDVTTDGCVELPFVADPTTISERCTTQGAPSATAPQATKRQVVRSLITHEVGHATGVNLHTTDSTDIMYQYTINWTRDAHFSPTADGLIQIHNAGVQ